MEAPAYGKDPLFSSTNRLYIVAGALCGACMLGIAVVVAGSGSTVYTLAAATFALMLLAGLSALVLDFPVIGIVRISFIASFFFKADINLFKIDDLEDPSGLNISLTLLLAAALLVYDLVNRSDRDRVFPPTFSWLLLALFVISVASVINAGPIGLGVFSLFTFGGSIMIAYAVASHFSQVERIPLLVIGMAAGLLFTGVVSISQFLFDFPVEFPSLGTGTESELLGTQVEILSRVQAFLRTPTEMAWVVCSMIPVVLAMILFGINKKRPALTAFLAVCAFAGVAATILSLARGSWIALGVGTVFLLLAGFYKNPSHERPKYFVKVLLATCLAAVFLVPFYSRIYERLTGDDRGAAAIRLPLMENAFNMIEDNMVIGVGLNGYRTHMTRYDDTAIFVSQIFPNPVHNIFAHVTAEIGIVGGFLFCLLLVYGIYEGFRNTRSRDRLLAAVALGATVGLIAFVISGAKEPGSLGSGRPPFRTCFLLLGTVMAISRINRQTDGAIRDFS
jgi:O-antigen ligase